MRSPLSCKIRIVTLRAFHFFFIAVPTKTKDLEEPQGLGGEPCATLPTLGAPECGGWSCGFAERWKSAPEDLVRPKSA